MKRELRAHAYLRFVDDFLLFADDKSTLWQWKAAVEERLAALRLTIHPRAQPRPVGEGIPFLGFVVSPERRRLKRRKGVAYERRFRRLLDLWASGSVDKERIEASVRGWCNHVSYGNTVGLREAVLGCWEERLQGACSQA